MTMKKFKYQYLRAIASILIGVICVVINVASLMNLYFGLLLLPIRISNIVGNGTTVLSNLVAGCIFLYRRI